MTQIHNVTVSSPPEKRKNMVEPKNVEQHAQRNLKKRKEPPKIVPPKINPEIRKPVPEPISFEVTFPDEKNMKVNETIVKDDDYEDDFESYESDFESSSEHEELSSSPEDQKDSTVNETSEEDEPIDRKDEGGEVKLDIDDEKKLDSGQYDMNINKKRLPTPPNFESIESSNSERTLDSGIGHFGHPTISSV
uniref:Uncharacterized protein n=1 Tax=Megaselia scalaris TaxID=36166 RepID=T1GXF3_MEGSC